MGNSRQNNALRSSSAVMSYERTSSDKRISMGTYCLSELNSSNFVHGSWQRNVGKWSSQKYHYFITQFRNQHPNKWTSLSMATIRSCITEQKKDLKKLICKWRKLSMRITSGIPKYTSLPGGFSVLAMMKRVKILTPTVNLWRQAWSC